MQTFRAIVAQNLRNLDAALARYLAFERTPTRERAATKSDGSRNHAGRDHATFLRAAHRNFSETLQFCRASWAQNLRDPDAGRFLFSDLNAMLTRSTLSDVVKYAQRTLAECTQFLCAGRAGFPEILQIFRAIFCAKFASSRRWTRALSCIRTHADSEKSCSEALRFAQPCWPSSRNFCARGAPIFFGNFAPLGSYSYFDVTVTEFDGKKAFKPVTVTSKLL